MHPAYLLIAIALPAAPPSADIVAAKRGYDQAMAEANAAHQTATHAALVGYHAALQAAEADATKAGNLDAALNYRQTRRNMEPPPAPDPFDGPISNAVVISHRWILTDPLGTTSIHHFQLGRPPAAPIGQDFRFQAWSLDRGRLYLQQFDGRRRIFAPATITVWRETNTDPPAVLIAPAWAPPQPKPKAKP